MVALVLFKEFCNICHQENFDSCLLSPITTNSVWMCVRTYASMYVCMYVCMYVRMYIRVNVYTYYVCMYVCMHACINWLSHDRITEIARQIIGWFCSVKTFTSQIITIHVLPVLIVGGVHFYFFLSIKVSSSICVPFMDETYTHMTSHYAGFINLK